MRNARIRAAAGHARIQPEHMLGIAALTLLITSAGGVATATASSSLHDAGRRAGAHQAESPNVATPTGENPLSRCLIGSWLHAWEEDTPEMIVYRPADYPFGPSRGRDGYEFQAGGALVYHGFGPADGPLTSPGAWAWTATDRIHLTVNDPRGAYIDETLRIMSCDANVLQVERLADADR